MSCDSITQQMTFATFAFQTIGYNGIVEVVSFADDPRPIFYDTYSGRLKFNVATSSGVWGCKAALEAELHNVRASMSGNSSSSGAGSNTGGGFLTSGSESGNISGGVSGNASGSFAEREFALNSELHKLNTNEKWYLKPDEQEKRKALAEKYYKLWQERGDSSTLQEAYTLCKVAGYYVGGPTED